MVVHSLVKGVISNANWQVYDYVPSSIHQHLINDELSLFVKKMLLF
jgi:hypothetical protein